MKKAVTLSLFLFVFCLFTFAQKINFGVTAGATFSKTKSEYLPQTDETKLKPGFTVGVFLVHQYNNKHFSFQPGLNFVQKGGKLEAVESGSAVTATTTLNYLEVPFNFLYSISKTGNGLFVGAGPWAAMGLSGKSKVESSGSSDSEDLEFGIDDIKDDLKTYDLGGNVLAGYKMSNGFSISGSYNFGFRNVTFDKVNKTRLHYFSVKLAYQLSR